MRHSLLSILFVQCVDHTVWVMCHFSQFDTVRLWLCTYYVAIKLRKMCRCSNHQPLTEYQMAMCYVIPVTRDRMQVKCPFRPNDPLIANADDIKIIYLGMWKRPIGQASFNFVKWPCKTIETQRIQMWNES